MHKALAGICLLQLCCAARTYPARISQGELAGMHISLLCLHIWVGWPHDQRWSGAERPCAWCPILCHVAMEGLGELQLSAVVCSYCTYRPCCTGHVELASLNDDARPEQEAPVAAASARCLMQAESTRLHLPGAGYGMSGHFIGCLAHCDCMQGIEQAPLLCGHRNCRLCLERRRLCLPGAQ